jgi:hypothetical protein
MTSSSGLAKTSLNAQVGAVALMVGSIAILALAGQEHSLAPLRLLTLAINGFGVWALCDELGMRKPLIRAGFVAFMFAGYARASTLIDTHSQVLGRFYLLYAFALMFAMLLWSVAYLHRQRELKVAGAIGALATIAPILALVLGHIALGAGAVLGIGSLLAAANGAALSDFSFIKTMDVMFSAWGLVSAWFLWRGHIRSGA